MNGSEKKLMEEMGVLWDKQARLKNKLSKHNQKGELSSRDIDEMNHITEDIKSCLYSSMELVNDQKNILLTLNELLSKDERRQNRRQIGMALEKPAAKKDFKKKMNPSS